MEYCGAEEPLLSAIAMIALVKEMRKSVLRRSEERKRGKAELTARRLDGGRRVGLARGTHKWNRLDYFFVLRDTRDEEIRRVRKTQPKRTKW